MVLDSVGESCSLVVSIYLPPHPLLCSHEEVNGTSHSSHSSYLLIPLVFFDVLCCGRRGSWALAQALAGDLGQNFLCGVFAHPSVSLETRAFQRDTEIVFRNIGRPVLLMNAKVRIYYD